MYSGAMKSSVNTNQASVKIIETVLFLFFVLIVRRSISVHQKCTLLYEKKNIQYNQLSTQGLFIDRTTHETHDFDDN